MFKNVQQNVVKMQAKYLLKDDTLEIIWSRDYLI